jgi:hypothetical protein
MFRIPYPPSYDYGGEDTSYLLTAIICRYTPQKQGAGLHYIDFLQYPH